MEDTGSDAPSMAPPSCMQCGKEATEDVPLKRCGKCHTTQYCSRECQKASWPIHKTFCGKGFDDLSKDWLHKVPVPEAYMLLIDCYRLRMEDDYVFSGDCDMDSIYGGAPNGYTGFRRFLKKAEKRKGLLPPWWSRNKAQECLTAGIRPNDEWGSLNCAVDKSDIIDHYSDSMIPMR